MRKLAIITSHPIQYYAPWFRYLTSDSHLSVKVFYLWNFGVTQQQDQGFKQRIQWDIPLLSGYDFEFVENTSHNPGTHHFWGLQNPSLLAQVKAYEPDTVLFMNYNYASLYQFLWHWKETPILFRGDSHRLVSETGPKAWARKQWIKALYQRFAACLYVGQANHRYFRYHGVQENRLFFSPHAVDNDRFFTAAKDAAAAANRWKQELRIPAHHAVILFAGKLIPKKRPLDLLQAFINANLPDVSLLFVGSGALEQELRQKTAQHSHIYFAPFQNQSLMARTYAIADLFVLPSYGSGETWGLAVNEAMCLSKPVIVSDQVGCAADLVKVGENGLVFPAGNVEALTHCLRRAMSDRHQMQVWGQNSHQHIQHFSYEQTTKGLYNAISCVNK